MTIQSILLVALVGNVRAAPSSDFAVVPRASETRINNLIKQMTLDEKSTLIGGNDFDTRPIPRLGIPAIRTTDGPLGVRNGKATAFPAGIALGASFDPQLTYLTADAIGEETRFIGRNMLLGPCVNISRQPFGGRNFESYGEDPFLSATMASSYVRGIQGQNILASVKHFAVNDQEADRMKINVLVDIRTLFEIHLPAFKAAVDAGSASVMAAYNRVNGQYAAENDYLLNHVLKDMWNYQGFVISDWGATHSTIDAAVNGLDLEMPFPDYFGTKLIEAVKNGDIPISVIDDKVRRILRAMDSIGLIDPSTSRSLPPPKGPASREHREVALRGARESIVLLKNENKLLPLEVATANPVKTLAVLGPGAKSAWTGGGGSSHVNPAFPVTPLEGLTDRLGKQVQLKTGDTLDESVAAARGADAAILFLGLSEWEEGEGNDRTSLELPLDQIKLIESVAAVNPNLIVVLNGGGPFTMGGWLSKAKAVLHMWYPGEEGGDAIADVLSGQVNPSGKLPVTFLKRWEDSPAYGHYPGTGSVQYSEGVFVGYRYFDARALIPEFPFGFGLSYTNYTYSNIGVRLDDSQAIDPKVHVSFDVKNTGGREGAEVAQLYVGEVSPVVPRPPHELKGFRRILLKPGETKHLEFDLEASAFSYFDVQGSGWKVNPGEFNIDVGSSSRDLPLHASVKLVPQKFAATIKNKK